MHVNEMSSFSATVNQEKEPPRVPTQEVNKKKQQHLGLAQTSFPTSSAEIGNNQIHVHSELCVSGVPTTMADIQGLPVMEDMLQRGTELKGAMESTDVMRLNSIDKIKKMQRESLSCSTNSSALPKNLDPLQSSMSKDKRSDSISSLLGAARVGKGKVPSETLKCKFSEKQSFKSLSSENTSLVPINSVPYSMTAELDPSVLISSTTTSVGAGTKVKSCPKRSIGKKKPIEALVASSPPPSKRPKITTTSIGAGTKVKACPKRSIGQKKPVEALVASSPPPSKRPKVSGSVPDEGFELPDVIALSDIDLKAQEDQLFTGQKHGSQVSKALGRVVQEKEELVLILQKAPLHKKLAQIMFKCGIKRIGKDVDHCLSLCVEERMHGLIQSTIRLSKQRVDFEKQGHQTVVSSNIQHQISVMNRELEEDRRKKQTEVKKLQKKANEEERVMCAAANAAAMAALGGNDLTSKWKLPLKCDGGLCPPSGPQPSNDASHVSLQTSVKTVADGKEMQQKGIENRSREGTFLMPQMKVLRSLSMKDVIATLEREPQMSKSAFIHRLHEKMYDVG